MKRTFEEFTGRGIHVRSGSPRLTLQENGKLSLNHAVLQPLRDPEAVVLLFDRETHSVGLRPASKGVVHAYPLNKHSATSRVSTIAAFAKHYDIPLAPTRSIEAELEDGVLVIDLDRGTPSGRRRAARAE